MKAIRVDLGERSYDVHVGAGTLPKGGALIPPVAGGHTTTGGSAGSEEGRGR